MKVLVAAEKNSLESRVARRFGHAPYYLIVDTENIEYQVQKNEHSGENHEMIYDFAKQGVKMFLTGNIGPHAFDIIKSLGLKVALARGISVFEALEKLHHDELQILDGPTLKRSVHDHAHRHNK